MAEQLPAPAPVVERLPIVPGRALALAPMATGDSVRRAGSVLRRRWLPFLVVLLATIATVAVYTWRKTPEYSATATLLVNARVVNIAAKDNEAIPAASDEDRAINAEGQILQSNEVADRVVAMVAARNPRWLTTLTKLPPQDARDAAVDAVKGRLRVDRPGGTNVLGVNFTAPDSALAAFAANAFAKAYLASKIDVRLGAARGVDKGLRQELDAMRGRVEEAEAAVADYRRKNNLLSADGVTLTEREQSLYKQNEAAAQTTLAEEQARLNTARAQLRHGSSGDDVGEALNSPVVNQLRGQRAVASARLAELQARYKDDYPSVIDARRQVADIDNAIHGEIRRVVSNLEARVQVAQQREGAASGIAGQSRGELASNAGAAVRLNELERRAEALRSNYAGLLQRQTAVASQAVVADSDARLLSTALVPKRPSTPNKTLNLALGGLLALLLAGGTVLVLQLLDQRFVSSNEVEDALGLDHLANIPDVVSIAGKGVRALDPASFVLDRPNSLLTESMRSLMLLLEQGRQPGRAQIVGLTSAQPGEGKSTLAACLARVAAASGRRVLLIEGDVRRPMLAPMLGLTPAAAGILDVMDGQASLEQALIQDTRSGAWLLPALSDPFRHGEMGAETRIAELMNRVRTAFDLVIVDTAPALAAFESRLLMLFVQHVVLVVRWKYTRAPAVRAAIKRLRAIGVEPLGVVISRVNMKAVAAYGVGDIDHAYGSLRGYFA